MDSIWDFLSNGTLPIDKLEAKRIRYRASKYWLQGDVLYKKSFNTRLLRCLVTAEAKYVLMEIHEGVCGNHSRSKNLAERAKGTTGPQ